jgi:hypothetical protein
MRIDFLHNWAPSPGRVVRIQPTAAALAAATAAPVSPGLPSFLQQDHLDAYRRTVAAEGTHRAWTGTASHQSGPLDPDALARALGDFVARHEGLRTWFDLSGPETVRRLVAVEDIAFEAVEIAGPEGDWASSWEEYVVGLADATCTPDSWPPFLLIAIVRDDDWSWLWACDHAFTDGASQLMVPAELANAYAAETGAPSFELPAAASFLDYAAAERDRAGTYDLESPEVQGWLEILQRHEFRLPRFPLDLGLSPGETAPVVLRESDALVGDEVAAFDALCKAAGGRFLSGVFAALAVTERRLAKVDRYLGAVVLGTRAGDTLMSHGWFCNFAPIDLPVGDEPFAETVVAAEEAYGVAKQLAAMPVHVALGALLMSGLATVEQLGSPQLVSYLDLRKFPGVGSEAYDRGMHFTGTGRTGNASLWINREDGRLQLGAQTPDTREAQEAVSVYFATVREVLLEALQGGASGAAHDG